MSIKFSKKVAALGVAGVAVLGGGAAAWAATTGGSDATTSTPATTAPAASATTTTPGKAHLGRAGRLGAIAGRTDHGVLEVKGKDGNWVTVTFDRGTVESASATSITLDRPDGQKATVAVTADTKVHGVSAVSDVQTGKEAVVVSQNGTATQIAQKAAS